MNASAFTFFFFAWSGQVDWLLPGAFNRIRAISVAAKLDVRMRLSRKQNSCFQLKSGVAPSADLWTVKMLKKFLIEKLPTYIPRLHSTKEITRTQKKGRCHVWSCPTVQIYWCDFSFSTCDEASILMSTSSNLFPDSHLSLLFWTLLW